MDQDFLLKTETAKRLFHDYAADMPIIDYHCHINPKEIYEDLQYENITQVWLYGDHYKWRAMRSCGINEYYITGEASDYEKFCKFAETLEYAIGNPLYHWSHLELKKYFGYDGVLSRKTAEQVWNLTKAAFAEEGLSVRNIIRKSNVEVICTTDDPVDSLEWHEKIAESDFEVKVLPAWRPDKAVNIEKETFADYIRQLGETAEAEIVDIASLKVALVKRMDYFQERGCSVSDHGLDFIPYVRFTEEQLADIFNSGRQGYPLTTAEIEGYKTEMMLFFAEEYQRRGWVMQLHYGCRRDNNQKMFDKLGPDTGFDCISNYTPADKLASFLDAANGSSGLPKTILYSLNPEDNAVIGTLIGCFQGSEAPGKIQHGSAWWFNDHKKGMEEQMTTLASLGLLGKFIGMLTDSRSFLSYTRHEYFRRILCNLIGTWVEDGEFPADEELLETIVKGVSHDNAARYFGF